MSDLKNKTRYTASLLTPLVEQLRKLSETTRISQAKLLEEAIQDLLKKHERN